MPFITKPNAKKNQDRKNRNRKTGLSKNSCTIYHKKNASAKSPKSAKKKHTAKTVASPKYQLFHEKSQRVSIKPATQTAFQGYSANDFPNNSHKNCPIIYLDYKTFSHVIRPQKCTKTTSVDFNRTLQMLLVQQKA